MLQLRVTENCYCTIKTAMLLLVWWYKMWQYRSSGILLDLERTDHLRTRLKSGTGSLQMTVASARRVGRGGHEALTRMWNNLEKLLHASHRSPFAQTVKSYRRNAKPCAWLWRKFRIWSNRDCRYFKLQVTMTTSRLNISCGPSWYTSTSSSTARQPASGLGLFSSSSPDIPLLC